MIKEFEKNLIYVFKKDKFEKAPCFYFYQKIIKDEVARSGIADGLNGYEVTFVTRDSGKIPIILNGERKDVCILPSWCEAYWKYEEV